ncbi:hypothetical protein Dimus_038153 [Dionaea muscipula]
MENTHCIVNIHTHTHDIHTLSHASTTSTGNHPQQQAAGELHTQRRPPHPPSVSSGGSKPSPLTTPQPTTDHHSKPKPHATCLDLVVTGHRAASSTPATFGVGEQPPRRSRSHQPNHPKIKLNHTDSTIIGHHKHKSS